MTHKKKPHGTTILKLSFSHKFGVRKCFEKNKKEKERKKERKKKKKKKRKEKRERN